MDATRQPPRALIILYNPADAGELAERIRREEWDASIYQHRGTKGFRGIRANPPAVMIW